MNTKGILLSDVVKNMESNISLGGISDRALLFLMKECPEYLMKVWEQYNDTSSFHKHFRAIGDIAFHHCLYHLIDESKLFFKAIEELNKKPSHDGQYIMSKKVVEVKSILSFLDIDFETRVLTGGDVEFRFNNIVLVLPFENNKLVDSNNAK